MNFDELRALLNLLEKERPDLKCRVSCLLDEALLSSIRKTHLVAIEESVWGSELTIVEKL